MIAGSIYGVVLNNSEELAQLEPALTEKPYLAPPRAPVVYMKPRSSVVTGPASVAASASLTAAATIALLVRQDTTHVQPDAAWAMIGGAALALDLMLPSPSYYRPTIANRNADGFLPLGSFGLAALPDEIMTSIDGAVAHRWSLNRLARDAAHLISEISQFMTLKGGDIMLIGLAGDAPTVRPGQHIRVEAEGFAPLNVSIVEEAA